MAAQPQQPIYPDELRFELDSQFSRITDYFDARFEKVLTQMRVDRREAFARDETLLKRLETVENGIRTLADVALKLTQKSTDLETAQQTTLQVIRDLHAEAMEAINELRPKGNDA